MLQQREGPGASYVAVGSLDPLTTGIPVTGEARLLATSVWYQIKTSDGNSWVNGAYIGTLGGADDATGEVLSMLGTPLADDDVIALGAPIANSFLGEEGGSWIALVALPNEDGPTTVTYDVIGLDNDAIKGYRLVIMANLQGSDTPYELINVERIAICWRGVDTNGLCA